MMLQMFVWESEMLENWQKGQIVVIAENADEARAIAAEHLEEWIEEIHGPEDEWSYSAERVAESREKFASDIAKEPEVETCLFLSGSA